MYIISTTHLSYRNIIADISTTSERQTTSDHVTAYGSPLGFRGLTDLALSSCCGLEGMRP
jgi:hypothetical protein